MADKISLERDHGASYEPTDSEDDFSEGEKEILKEVRQGRESNKNSKRELLAFADSDDDDNEDDGDDDDDGEGDSDDTNDLMNDSDIEGAGDGDDNLPDAMDWGSKSRNYYNTDFVDPDYSAYTAEEAELAKQEEEEAKVIQLRLAKQMKEEDFMLDDALFKTATPQQTEISKDATKLKADFSGLTKREKLQLFQKDSPEFAALTSDFKALMKEVESLHTPVLQYVKSNKVPMIPALEFTELYRNLALTYCSNISFYLLLKAKRIVVRNHPITKRLAQLKKLLLQLQDKYDNIIKPQLEALLERIVDGDQFEVLDHKPAVTKKVTKKSKLSILDQYNEGEDDDLGDDQHDNDDEELIAKQAAILKSSDEEDAEEDVEAEGDEELDENERRGITYQIAKNKGLTPHRKKEVRNPRVKHRSKFRKALIRRKGAVRTVRTETKRYGGEISGIKSTVVKSVKFKT